MEKASVLPPKAQVAVAHLKPGELMPYITVVMELRHLFLVLL